VDGLVGFYMRTGLYYGFCLHGQADPAAGHPVLYFDGIFLRTSFHHVRRFHASHLQSAQGNRSENQPPAAKSISIPPRHGEVLSRITNDVDLISQSLNQSISQLITSVATVIGVLGMMLSINVLMTVVAILTVSMSFGFIGAILKTSQKFFRAQQASLGKMNGHVEEMYGGHTIVQAFNRQDDSIERFYTINETLCDSAWKSQFFTSIMQALDAVCWQFRIRDRVHSGWLSGGEKGY